MLKRGIRPDDDRIGNRRDEDSDQTVAAWPLAMAQEK
jgi:hypothetical protein